MSISRVFAAAAIAVTFNLNSAQAQTLSNGLIPAEFPPSSYKGRQYVDSEGCVFIRAGVDGNVTWIPRVTRSRKAICGFQPTFARQAKPVVVEAPEAATVVAPQPTYQPKKVKRTTRAAAQAQPVLPAAKKGDPACRGGNAVSQQYVGRVGENVRCGPQQGSLSAYSQHRNSRSGSSGHAQDQVQSATTRVVPRHVYESQMVSVPGIGIPEGYKPAWDDDRLNPRRVHQTMAGEAQMNQVWTQTLPRKLIRHDASAATSKSQTGQYVATSQIGTTVTVSTRSKPAKSTQRKGNER
ncbi:hypothetical protein [uncultured Roseovarius sp.]|uniref:hypothetical protein n=1 Tax=uncultured Roseovarius sp. TaxID=293344 RepID=UPI00261C0CA8|nr:hypothetical protein [uncultured Roseovarius sp.]